MLSLDVEAREGPEVPNRVPRRASESLQNAGVPVRILVVEDDLDLAANLGDFLELRGHSVDFAAAGQLGLSLAESQRFDAIVLDRLLPVLDGASLCRLL